MAIFTSKLLPRRGSAKPPAPPLTWRMIRANGRPADVVAFEESVVAFFLETSQVLGVPKSLGAIYGVCFASPTPLSFSEVQERLDISAGSISQGLRVLREVGALKVVTTEPDRREYFAPDLELRKLIAHYLEQRLQKQMDTGRSRLQDLAESVPGGNEDADKVLRTRLKALQAWHDKARALMPVVRTFLKLS